MGAWIEALQGQRSGTCARFAGCSAVHTITCHWPVCDLPFCGRELALMSGSLQTACMHTLLPCRVLAACTCPACFATLCMCAAPPSPLQTTSSSAYQSAVSNEDDRWNCHQCGGTNYAWREFCSRCRRPNPAPPAALGHCKKVRQCATCLVVCVRPEYGLGLWAGQSSPAMGDHPIQLAVVGDCMRQTSSLVLSLHCRLTTSSSGHLIVRHLIATNIPPHIQLLPLTCTVPHGRPPP